MDSIGQQRLLTSAVATPGRAGSQGQRFRRPSGARVPVQPQGKQNLSLFRVVNSSVKIANKAVFGGNQYHFDKDSSTSEKAGIIVGNIRSVAEIAQKIVLSGVKSAKAIFKMKTGSWSVPNPAIDPAYRGLLGLTIASQGLTFVKGASNGIWQAGKDISAHRQRSEARTLLKDYDPATRSITGNPEQVERLEKLLADNKSDVARSKAQVAVDHLSHAKDLLIKGAGVVDNSFLLAEGFSSVAAKAVPGVNIAVAALSTIHSEVKTATQVVALDNLAKAEAATNDPLLQALAGHIRQERTILARKHLISTALNTAVTGLTIGLAASGAGAPAALIGIGATGVATGIGTLAFDAYHNRKLAKARNQSTELMASRESLTGLARTNIGVAERAFLLRLRTAEGEELKESIRFLRNFGVTDNTIKKLQLAPEKAALKTLQGVLYRDKVKCKGLQLKQTAKSLSHVAGFTALGKRIKAGSLWLISKLTPQRRSETWQGVLPSGNGLAFDPLNDQKHTSRVLQLSLKIKYRPACATIPNLFHYGRITQ